MFVEKKQATMEKLNSNNKYGFWIQFFAGECQYISHKNEWKNATTKKKIDDIITMERNKSEKKLFRNTSVLKFLWRLICFVRMMRLIRSFLSFSRKECHNYGISWAHLHHRWRNSRKIHSSQRKGNTHSIENWLLFALDSERRNLFFRVFACDGSRTAENYNY